MGRRLDLVKGIFYNTAQNIAAPYIDKALNIIAPPTKFQDNFAKAQTGNVNKSDNWGTFGTFLAKTAYDILTAPDNQTNSALPPTEGSVTKYAPAIISARPQITRPTRARRLRGRGSRGIAERPVRTMRKKKTVADLTNPKKKARKYVYRVNI